MNARRRALWSSFELLGFAALLLLAALFLKLSGATQDWDRLVYDQLLRTLSGPAPPDIIIVAIDRDSLAKVGRWPWPRRKQAELVERLTEAGPALTILDIANTEPEHEDPEGDRALAAALRDNGRVVLPVFAEEPAYGVEMQDALPIPPLLTATAAIGHAHVEQDKDGVSRRVFLKNGWKRPHWSTLTLAGLELMGEAPDLLPGRRAAAPPSGDEEAWFRDHEILIPYARPGAFERESLSAHEVLSGNFSTGDLNDKIVLVGFTSTGLGDMHPTPVSGLVSPARPMPGVEIHANILATLRAGTAIVPISTAWNYGLTMALVLLPAFVYPRLSPRLALVASGMLALATALGSLFLLGALRLWYPPTAAILVLASSYPVWSWRRLEFAARFLEQELERLGLDRGLPALEQTLPYEQRFTSATRHLPILGWSVHHSQRLENGGDYPANLSAITTDWGGSSEGYWKRYVLDKPLTVGVRLRDEQDAATLLSYVDQIVLVDNEDHPKQKWFNIAERIQARAFRLRDARKRLQRVKDFVQSILESLPEGVMVANAYGQIILANEMASRFIAGRTEPSPQSLTEVLSALGREEDTSRGSPLAELLLDGKSWSFEFRDATQQLLVDLRTIRGDLGQPWVIVNLVDVTVLKESERKRGELIDFLSHDLRAPLVSSISLLQLLGYGRELDNQPARINKAEHNVRESLDMIDNLLNLSRAEHLESPTFEPVQISAMGANAADKVWPQSDAKQIALTRKIADDDLWVHGEADLIERALVNLLVNAVKYSPPDSEITLCIGADGSDVRCCVTDQGPGIPNDQIPNLFKRFQRRKDKAKSKEAGIGLGLALVERVALGHSGTVEVTSAIGRGSTFCLVLPLMQPSD